MVSVMQELLSKLTLMCALFTKRGVWAKAAFAKGALYQSFTVVGPSSDTVSVLLALVRFS